MKEMIWMKIKIGPKIGPKISRGKVPGAIQGKNWKTSKNWAHNSKISTMEITCFFRIIWILVLLIIILITTTSCRGLKHPRIFRWKNWFRMGSLNRFKKISITLRINSNNITQSKCLIICRLPKPRGNWNLW